MNTSLAALALLIVLAVASATHARTYSILDSYFTEVEDFCTRRALICDNVEVAPDHGDMQSWSQLYNTCKEQRATCQFMMNLNYVLALENITNCRRIEEYCYGINDIFKSYPDDMLVQTAHTKCHTLAFVECKDI